MKISAIKCLKCGDKIFSRARHDFHGCGCQDCFIDGGFDYLKISGDNFEIVEIDVDVSKEELYNDWNKGIDKHGVIKNEE